MTSSVLNGQTHKGASSMHSTVEFRNSYGCEMIDKGTLIVLIDKGIYKNVYVAKAHIIILLIVMVIILTSLADNVNIGDIESTDISNNSSVHY